MQLQQFQSLKPFTLASLDQSKPTYIKFWPVDVSLVWSKCRILKMLYQVYGDKVNFVAVNININEKRQEISMVQQRFKLSMPIYLDQQGQKAV